MADKFLNLKLPAICPDCMKSYLYSLNKKKLYFKNKNLFKINIAIKFLILIQNKKNQNILTIQFLISKISARDILSLNCFQICYRKHEKVTKNKNKSLYIVTFDYKYFKKKKRSYLQQFSCCL